MSDQPFSTCAEAAEAASDFLAKFEAVCRVRPPTPKEAAAAKRARNLMQGYGIPIPEGLR